MHSEYWQTGSWVKSIKASTSFAPGSIINGCNECGRLGHCNGDSVQIHCELFVAVQSNYDMQREYLVDKDRKRNVCVLLHY